MDAMDATDPPGSLTQTQNWPRLRSVNAMAARNPQSRKDQALVISEQRISQSPSVSLYVAYHTLPTLFSRRIPCFGLSALFLASSLFPPSLHAQTFTPPFVLRMGFGAIFAGAGYVLASGDSRNGSGIATAWSLSYFVLEQFSLGLQRSLRLPRSGLALTLSGATTATAMLYGMEHFVLGDEESELD
ncbi:hypothetical protein BJV74DRAFT_884256 [Russula compacta]|nr:hypothetical protein BJV74DRAFT_884256 [Russula compacta]